MYQASEDAFKTKKIDLTVFFSVGRFVQALACLVILAGLSMATSRAQADVVDLFTGISSYIVPIETPSGTNGVGPSLSLAYSSSGSNGWLGLGWNLTGLGSIDRLGPTYSNSPTYTAEDTYRLNIGGGAKLVYTGADPGGVPGNYYRTQVESFQRIEFITASNTWVVTDKTGVKYFFGQTAATRQSNPGNVAQVFSWKLDKVQDPHGVFWTVSYSKDALNGDMYPQQIVYSQGPGLACTPSNLTACRTIDFVLRPRTDIANYMNDTLFSYNTGALIVSDQLLQRIDVKLGGKLIRGYQMSVYHFIGNSPDYSGVQNGGVGPLQGTRITQLLQIDQVAADGSIILPSYKFSYHTNNYDSVTNAAATTLIKTNVAGSPAEGVGGVPLNPGSPSNCTYMSDMNNDGRSDVLVGNALTSGGWYYYPSLGNGAFGAKVPITSPATSLPSLCTATSETQRYYTGETYQKIYYGTELQADGNKWLEGSIGWYTSGWIECIHNCSYAYTDAVQFWTVTYPLMASKEIITPVRDSIVMDVDGDGLPDVLSSTAVGQWYWWKGTPGGQFANRAAINSGVTEPLIQLIDKDVRLVDMDADGLPDLVKMVYISGTCSHEASTWRIDVYRNQGRDASGVLRFSAAVIKSANLVINVDMPPPQSVPIPCTAGVPPMPSNGFAFIDFSGDGLPDLVWFTRASSSATDVGVRSVSYYPNQGRPGGVSWSYGVKVDVSTVGFPAYGIMTQVDRWIDMNGDGMLDLLIGFNAADIKPGDPNYAYYPLTYNQLSQNGSIIGRVDMKNTPTDALTRDKYMTLADINGDGNVSILQGQPGNYVTYSLNHTSNHRFLQEAANPMGMTTTYAYNKFLSGNTIRWVTNTVTQSDNLSQFSRLKYTYSGGKSVGWPSREFRGYASTKVTDLVGSSNTTNFNQGDADKGSTASTVTQNMLNQNMKRVSKTYNVTTPVTGVSRVDLQSVQEDMLEGGSTAKTRRTDYANYDNYGNAKQVTISGDNIITRVTTTDYAYNIPSYLFSTYHSQSNIGSVAGTKIAESWFDYDNQTNGYAPTAGNLTRETHWLLGGSSNPVIQYSYDIAGNRVGVFDANHNTCTNNGWTSLVINDPTYLTYPVTEINALCQQVSKTYWGINATLNATSVTGAYATPGYLATVTDINGVRSDSYWDSSARPKARVVPPDSTSYPTTVWSYGMTGTAPSYTLESKRETSGAAGTHDKFVYVDGFNRTVQVKSEAVRSTEWVTQDTWTNNIGLTEGVTVPYFSASSAYSGLNTSEYTTTTMYDAMNRPIKITNPDNTYRSFIYTPYTVATTDENYFTTSRTYDALNRLINVVEPAGGGVTNYYYDYFDATGYNFQFIVDAAGNTTQTQIDSLGRTINSYDADRGWLQYTYDANSNLLSTTDAKSQVLTYTYDKLNRINTKAYPGNAGVITYYYDDATGGAFRKGRLWKVTDLTGSSIFSYDLRGRQTQVDKTIGASTYTAKYTYDSMDRYSTIFYPNNEYVGFQYNNQGLVNSINYFNGSYITNLDYNALGQLTLKALGNGKVTTYDYLPDSQRLRNIYTSGLQSLSFNYDNIGNVKSITDTIKNTTQNFGYDNLHRLTSASDVSAPAYNHTYTYDTIGNMKTGAGKTLTYPVAGAIRPHALTSDGSCSYLYDANGSTSTRTCGTTVRTYAWDYDNRLSQVKNGSTVLETNNYDYAGVRVKKVEGTTTTLTPFPFYRLVNGAATKYYFLNGMRIAERDSANAVFYYYADHLGSSNKVSSSTGAEVKFTQFYPYGVTRTETGTKTIAHKYTGQELDTSTGLYNYGARYYDPATMHFLSADNIIPSMADPQTLNRFAYANNNPVKFIDPSGKTAGSFDSMYSFIDNNGQRRMTYISEDNKVLFDFTPHPDYPDSITPFSWFFHGYATPINLGNYSPVSAVQKTMERPTHDTGAATSEGTYNDANPGGFGYRLGGYIYSILFNDVTNLNPTWTSSNPVLSLKVFNKMDGSYMSMNMALPGHPFFPGVLVHWVLDSPQGTVLNNFGIGTSIWQTDKSPFKSYDVWKTWAESDLGITTLDHNYSIDYGRYGASGDFTYYDTGTSCI